MKKFLSFILMMLFGASYAQQAIITRGPFLQMATQNSIKILWRTNIPTDSRVVYGFASNNLALQKVDNKLVIEHEITLTDLSTDVQYYYGVGTVNLITVKGDDYYFRTLPQKGYSEKKYTFWMVGDAGDSSDNQRLVRDEFIKYMKNKAADAMVLLGDNAYDNAGESEYQNKFFGIYQNTILKNTLLIPAPGNHEYLNPAWNPECCSAPYFQIFTNPTNGETGGLASGNEGFYAYDYGNVHFIVLDSYGIYGGKKLYDPTNNPQIEWLKKDVAASLLPWKVVVMHHPPYTKRSHDSDIDADLILLRQNLNPILENLKIDLVVSGHSHLYERYHKMLGHYGYSYTFDASKYVPVNTTAKYDNSVNSCPYTSEAGTMYIVAGSAGRNNGFPERAPHPAAITSIAGIGGSLVLEVEGNRLTGKWINSTGTIMDTFTQYKNLTKSSKFNVDYGIPVELKASWDAGTYQWQSGEKTRILSSVLVKDTTFRVTDGKNCLEETFSYTVAPQPELTLTPISTLVCTGTEAQAAFSVTNTSIENKIYNLLLSDNKGSFDKNYVLATSTKSPIAFKLPDTLSAGTYQLKIQSTYPWFKYNSPISIDTKRSPSGVISGDSTIRLTEKASIKITLDGTPPIDYVATGNISGQATTTPKTINIELAPIQTTSYQLTSVKNACGERLGSGTAKITVLPPLGSEPNAPCQLCVYPNPIKEFVEVEMNLKPSNHAQISVVDMQGKQLHINEYKAKQSLDFSGYSSGKYLIIYQDDAKKLSRQVVKE